MTVILQLVYISILCRIYVYITYIQNFLQKSTYLSANHNQFIECNFYYLSSIIMISKCQHIYLKAASKVSIILFIKRRSEASLFSTLYQCKINDNKLSTTNTSNTKDDFQTLF